MATKTEYVAYNDVKVGDLLARSAFPLPGYCAPANSFVVTEVVKHPDGKMTLSYEAPDGEVTTNTFDPHLRGTTKVAKPW